MVLNADCARRCLCSAGSRTSEYGSLEGDHEVQPKRLPESEPAEVMNPRNIANTNTKWDTSAMDIPRSRNMMNRRAEKEMRWGCTRRKKRNQRWKKYNTTGWLSIYWKHLDTILTYPITSRLEIKTIGLTAKFWRSVGYWLRTLSAGGRAGCSSCTPAKERSTRLLSVSLILNSDSFQSAPYCTDQGRACSHRGGVLVGKSKPTRESNQISKTCRGSF